MEKKCPTPDKGCASPSNTSSDGEDDVEYSSDISDGNSSENSFVAEQLAKPPFILQPGFKLESLHSSNTLGIDWSRKVDSLDAVSD